jgi:hypothetical protein
MTYQPGEQPYTQPQDPWLNTQGLASAPTDPLPALARGSGHFAPGVASPVAWSAETVAHSDPYLPAEKTGGRAGLYVLVALLVVVLGGAGGFGAWWAITNYGGSWATPSTSNTTTPAGEESPTPEPTELAYRPELVEVGTCLTNRGTIERPQMWIVPCDRADTYEVLKVVKGADIPKDAAGAFTEEATATPVCADVPSDSWFGWNSPNDAQDHFYCMRTNVTAS